MTPDEVADHLGMSRTHVRRLVDLGEIVVGDDQHVSAAEVARLAERRRRDHRELTERFASQEWDRAAALDRLADDVS